MRSRESEWDKNAHNSKYSSHASALRRFASHSKEENDSKTSQISATKHKEGGIRTLTDHLRYR